MGAVQKINAARSRPAAAGDLGAQLGKSMAAALAGDIHRLPPEELLSAWGAHFSLAELHELVVPERTLARRIAKREKLTIGEGDRAMRLARIALEANRVFGASEKAGRWLRKPNTALAGQTPLAMLRSEIGAKAVEELLVQIDHGIFT